MSERPENLLLQTLPERGPGRTVMGLVATAVAITTTAATYLLGANHAVLGTIVLLLGLVAGVALFWLLKSHVLDEQCFNASLPFTLDDAHATEAREWLEKLREDCAALVPACRVRANVFRPSDRYQRYGCAYILEMDERIESQMSRGEIESIRFLPGQGHTGRAFVAARSSYGTPDVAITREQFEHIVPELAYVMSFPLHWKGGVLGVLNLDFCCETGCHDDAHKRALIDGVVRRHKDIEQRVDARAALIATALGKGNLRNVRLLRGR